MKKNITILICLIMIITSAYIPVMADGSKAAAIQELTDIYRLYDDFDYTEENWTTLTNLYNAGITSINNSTGEDNIYNSLNEAAESMISVPSKYRSVKVCISLDKLTLSKGFIIEPEFITVKKYSPASKVLTDFFDKKYDGKVRNPLFYNGTVYNDFELTGVYEEYEVTGDIKEIDVPDYLIPYVGRTITEKTAVTPLCAGDYTQESCFVYSINNKFPNVKASAIPVIEEDVLRWQFSIYGKGADVGANTYYSDSSISNFADKSELLWEFADTNRKYDLDVVLADETNLKYYSDAYRVLIISNISQTAVDKALKKLKSIVPPTQDETPPTTTPDTEDTEDTEIIVPDETPEEEMIFSDVDHTHYAKQAISYLASKNIVNGLPDGSFGVNNTLTRAELATMLARSAGYNENDSVPFVDVASDDWFYTGVAFCYTSGITNGQTPTVFNPYAPITRQELATMLYRYASFKDIAIPTNSNDSFKDESSFALYATEAINALHSGGIINGFEGNIFAPTNNATRAEMAKMLYNLLTINE